MSDLSVPPSRTPRDDAIEAGRYALAARVIHLVRGEALAGEVADALTNATADVLDALLDGGHVVFPMDDGLTDAELERIEAVFDERNALEAERDQLRAALQEFESLARTVGVQWAFAAKAQGEEPSYFLRRLIATTDRARALLVEPVPDVKENPQ